MTPAAKAAAAKQAAYEEFAKPYADKNWSKDIVELFMAIKVDRAAYDRVQQKNKHTDQRMIQAARDTRDLGLTGRQNLDDISNSSKEDIAALKKHAQGGSAPKSSRR